MHSVDPCIQETFMAQPIPPVDPTIPDYGTVTGDLVVEDVAVPAAPSLYQQDGGEQSAVEVTKDQAAQISQSAADAGQHVAQVAKDQLGTVAGEAGRQTKDLLHQTRTELTQQAGQQQQRVAEGLQALSKELHSMSRHEGETGLATDLARQGAHKAGELASWLDSREPGQLVNEVKTFARQRPGTFLLLAAGLGLAAGRLTRGVTASDSDAGAQPAGAPTEHLATPQPQPSFDELSTGPLQ
jgi:hypothetical protein